MEPRLQKQLAVLDQMHQRQRLWREMKFAWLAVIAIGVLVFVIQSLTASHWPLAWMIPLLAGLIVAGIAWSRYRSKPKNDFRHLVASLEREHPELRHLLSAAVEQQPDSEFGELRFLQLRAIEAVLDHPNRYQWLETRQRQLSSAGTAHFAAFAVAMMLLLFLARDTGNSKFRAWLAPEISITPGDTLVERGSSLVVSARFGGQPPAESTLVLLTASGKTKRFPMERHLADPVFGASAGEMAEEGLYHVEYEGHKTGDFKVKVFDFPALVRADALLQFPGYTGLTNKTIPDTRRVSAIEGTRLSYTFQLNKPVTSATLISSNGSVNLALKSNSVAALDEFVLTNSERYALVLQDAEGRSNKFPTDFVFQVLPNKPPEIKVDFPTGDPRVSRIEELHLQGEARGEFGLLKYGVGYGVAGEDPKIVEIGQTVPHNEKRQFEYLIPLETLPLEPDKALAYFVWADDRGPDGEIRRTFSDMFFAEVRPFEEAFRAQQQGESSGQGQGENEGNKADELAQMQKDIVIATWKLKQGKLPKIPKRSP
ncbi:MAG TPA: hypothetical protein VGO67_17260 [Verrucomicrobiae bacterium]|jgi:hypothetical protein